MFAKRVKTIRKMNSEVEIIDKRITREITKLNDNLGQEIKKRLKKIIPNVQIKIRKISLDDFLINKKKDLPLSILIESFNGKFAHKNGFWIERDRETGNFFKVENRLELFEFEDICRQMSEDLGILIQLDTVDENYR